MPSRHALLFVLGLISFGISALFFTKTIGEFSLIIAYVAFFAALIATMLGMKMLCTHKTVQRKKEAFSGLCELVEYMPYGIFILNQNGTILAHNTVAMTALGYKEGDLIEKSCSVLFSGKPPQQIAEQNFSDISEENAAFQCKNNALLGVRYGMKQIILDSENTPSFLLFFSDITKEKEIKEELENYQENMQELVDQQTFSLLAILEESTKTTEEARVALKKAERADKAKSEFLANMTHELRTPLHAILSLTNINMKDRTLNDPEKLKKNLQLVSASGNHLLMLLNDLLDLSKLESGSVTYNFDTHDIRMIVEKVITQLSSLIKEKHLCIDIVEEPDTPLSISLDKTKITQLLWNLLSNAIKFSRPKQSITVALDAASLPDPEKGQHISSIAISVIDHGIGIPEGETETIFDKFVQSTKTKTGAGGTGLGLAICREIAQGHNGKIWAENNIGAGAKLTCVIPVEQTAFLDKDKEENQAAA